MKRKIILLLLICTITFVSCGNNIESPVSDLQNASNIITDSNNTVFYCRNGSLYEFDKETLVSKSEINNVSCVRFHNGSLYYSDGSNIYKDHSIYLNQEQLNSIPVYAFSISDNCIYIETGGIMGNYIYENDSLISIGDQICIIDNHDNIHRLDITTEQDNEGTLKQVYAIDGSEITRIYSDGFIPYNDGYIITDNLLFMTFSEQAENYLIIYDTVSSSILYECSNIDRITAADDNYVYCKVGNDFCKINYRDDNIVPEVMINDAFIEYDMIYIGMYDKTVYGIKDTRIVALNVTD